MDEPLQEEILTLQGEQKFAPVGKLGALAKAMVGALSFLFKFFSAFCVSLFQFALLNFCVLSIDTG